jgi:tetratricopeptide (TPR) repeat protein
LISYSLAGLMLSNSDPDSAEPLLQEALDTGSDPAEDKFAAKYLYTRLQISLAPGITAELPVNRDAVGLALAELRQERGDLDGAIEGVEQLEPSTYAAVSLADLYAAAGRFDEVIALTEGLRNEDDASALLLTYRGMALRQKGFTDAAHEALKEALRARSRSAAIRHLALVERADNYLAQNKKAMARKDLERILAEDSTVEGVADRLAALQEG